jgi:hypothetical protein
MKDSIAERFRANLERVRNIVAVYQDRAGGSRGRPSVQEADILRAAVVLLHAALEDLLRGLVEWKLPAAPPGVLGEIPLTGTKDHRRTSFTLADLASHRGAAVNDVIRKSVMEWLERSNYNNEQEVARALQQIGIAPKPLLDRYGRQLETLMQRRHVIAHRADRNDARGSGQHRTLSISARAVGAWIATVERFGTDLLGRI